MTDAYDAWAEAGRRLAEAPGDSFLANVRESLRAEALTDFLERFVGEHSLYAEEIHVSSEDVPDFFSRLDELRQPPPTAADEARREAFAEAVDVLDKMKRLNWTGDHLYGDALDDAQVILSHVREGRGWPVLERFRCPSIRKKRTKNGRVDKHCVLQLPHSCDHKSTDGSTWTDEQSVNPPVPYDSEAGVPEAGPILRCSEWLDAEGRRGHCEHNAAHPGAHIAAGFGQWYTDCGAEHVITGQDGGAEAVHCSMHKGHAGPSHFDVRSGNSWPVA